MIFKELTKDEISMIDEYRCAYAYSEENSSNENFASAEYVLREWNEKKENLFHLFGDKLIIKKEVQYEKSLDEIETEMNEMLSYSTYGRAHRSGRRFYDNYMRWVDDAFTYCYAPYAFGDRSETDEEFQDRINQNSINRNLISLLNLEQLSKNCYIGRTFDIPTPDGKSIKIPNGCKIGRVLGKIAEKFNIEGYEDFRICHSQILNQKKLTGTLCLSIHPMDFFTMSDNECGWRSCMSWANFGEYRQGTVEMMNSPTVVVAYLTSNDDMVVPGGYKWNSKKWRKLFVVDPRCLISVKDYPYINNDLTKIVLNWIKDLAEKNMGYQYKEDMMTYTGSDREVFIPKENDDSEDSSYYFNFETNCMYSDFGCTKSHYMYIGSNIDKSHLNRDWNNNYSIDIPYSGKSECMICGELNPDLDEESNLACSKCEYSERCDWCEERSSELIEVDGTMLCPDCFDDYTTECVISGKIHMMDNMVGIFVIPRLSEDQKGKIEVSTGESFKQIESEYYYRHYEPDLYFYDDFSDEQFEEDVLIPGAKIHKVIDHYCPKKFVYFDEINEEIREEHFGCVDNEDYLKYFSSCYLFVGKMVED